MDEELLGAAMGRGSDRPRLVRELLQVDEGALSGEFGRWRACRNRIRRGELSRRPEDGPDQDDENTVSFSQLAGWMTPDDRSARDTSAPATTNPWIDDRRPY